MSDKILKEEGKDLLSLDSNTKKLSEQDINEFLKLWHKDPINEDPEVETTMEKEDKDINYREKLTEN